MNKEIIGKFLKTLREEKNLTQIQLSNEFSEVYYSDAQISKWETGKAVPNVDDLKILAKYFNVTVDEILNGSRYQEANFEDKYFIYNTKWMSRYKPDELYNIREEQELLIETRFKELLKKIVGDGLSLSEDKEFDFLVNHFYQIFIPAIECIDKNAYRNSGVGGCAWVEDIDRSSCDCLIGDLADIKFEIYKQTALMHNSTIEEKYWEANKKFIFIKRQNIREDINDVIEDRENDLKNRLSTLDEYEKDILLATLQQVNVVNTLASTSPKGKELYEKKYGRKYDDGEQLTKKAIKLLIECGAKLNKSLLCYWQVVVLERSILGELENIHKKYNAPLLVPICEKGRYHYFTVDNIESNRAKLDIKYKNEDFDENDYKELERRLYVGEKVISKPYKVWSYGPDEWDAFLHARNQMMIMSLDAYNENRDAKLTKALFMDLDSLTLAEIREKYFPLEYKGEYIDDANSMSFEELNKKYYIKGVPNE